MERNYYDLNTCKRLYGVCHILFHDQLHDNTLHYRAHKHLDVSQMIYHNSEISAVIETISAMTNPFDPDLKDLINIASGEVENPCVVTDMLAAKEIGERKFKEFVDDKVKAEKPDIFTTIPKTNLKTFTKRNVKSQVKTKKGEIVELRNDAKFISRLLAIGESREVDMKNLMLYSLRKFPHPFATVDGELVKSPKCKLLHELVGRVTDPMVEMTQTSGALLLDAMAMLQTLKYIPQTFGELAEKILQMLLSCARAANAERVDFVSDGYPAVSIKNLEQNKRAVSGVTQIRIGGPNQKVSHQFKRFLSLGENKESLIEFIFKHFCTMKLEGKLSRAVLFPWTDVSSVLC